MIIAFIGAGKMAEALISQLGPSTRIIASDKDERRLKYLKAKYKIKVTGDNVEAFQAGDVVILAVKPQNFSELLSEIRSPKSDKLIISIAAGVPLSYLQKKLPGYSIIRAMPNNPCLAGAGMTALAKGKRVTGNQYLTAEKIFKAVGEVVAIPEKWMDAVTGLSGSGPAFVYGMVEALAWGGEAAGLPGKVASRLALQTTIGAAATLKHTGRSPHELRTMVASPGGTTIEGLVVLEKHKTAKAFKLAVQAAARKSKLLSKRFGK